MDTLDQIKDRINIIDLARSAGFVLKPENKSQQRYVTACIFHNDGKRPNLSLYGKTNTYKCFACGANGDAINFYAKIRNIENIDAIRELKQQHGIKNLATMPYKPAEKAKPTTNTLKTPEEKALAERAGIIFEALKNFCGDLSADSFEYLTGKKRGLKPETIKQFGIFDIKDYKKTKTFLLDNFSIEDLKTLLLLDSRNRFAFTKNKIVIPIIEDGKIITLRGRFFDNGLDNPDQLATPTYTYPKYKSMFIGGGHFFNADILKGMKQGEKVFLSEGEFDAMILTQSGYKAIGLMGVSSYTEAMIKRLKGFELILCLDSDERGKREAQKIADIYSKATGAKVVKYFNLEGAKDITELYLKRHNGEV